MKQALQIFFIFESLHCALMQIIQLPGCPLRESCSTALNALRWRNHSVPLITGTTKIKLFSNHFMTLCYDTAETFNHTLTKSLFILKK